MTVHRFQEDLEFSHNMSDAPWWEEVYRRAFPGFQAMTCVRKDGWAQRGGIDRVVVLSSGKVLNVDEKVRRKAYPDILLERYSDADRKTPGWVQKNLATDFIAYARVPTQQCVLLPFIPLRRAWISCGRDWIARYGTLFSDNENYRTESVPVPDQVLMEAIKEALWVEWAA